VKTTTLERLLKVGKYSELFGLFSGYDLKKVTDKICLWGLTGSLWTKAAIETVISPFRKHALQQHLSENAVDEAICHFAQTANIDKNLVRRIYWGVASEPKEKPEENPEEIIDEAEEDLPEFDEDSVDEESVESD